jgi:hypothetical protein
VGGKKAKNFFFPSQTRGPVLRCDASTRERAHRSWRRHSHFLVCACLGQRPWSGSTLNLLHLAVLLLCCCCGPTPNATTDPGLLLPPPSSFSSHSRSPPPPPPPGWLAGACARLAVSRPGTVPKSSGCPYLKGGVCARYSYRTVPRARTRTELLLFFEETYRAGGTGGVGRTRSRRTVCHLCPQ